LGVPRLQRSSKTSDPNIFRIRDGYLTKLAELECAAELQAFASGEVTIGDIARAFEESNARGFLAGIRARRATCPPAAAVAAPPGVDETIATALHASSTLRDATSAVEDSRLLLPLWSTALDKTIPSMDEIEATSQRRYSTAIRALRLKMHLFALPQEYLEVITDLDLTGAQSDAVEFARTRGLTIGLLLETLSLPADEQLLHLRAQGVRLGEGWLAPLRSIPKDAWTTLGAGTDFIPDLETIDRISLLDDTTRLKLRAAATILGPHAAFVDLARLTKGDWRRFSKHWGESAADWNHVRRTLSAVISTLRGTSRSTFRGNLIDAIPLLKEHERVPDITPELLGQILDLLPPEAMGFPRALVLTGCRISEYQRLVPGDLKRHTYKVQVKGTKTVGSDREVSIAPSMWHHVVDAVPAPRSAGWMRRTWREACAKVQLYGVTLHDLRHCHGQWAIDGGASEQAVQVSLGHVNPAMTRRYTKTVDRGKVADAIRSTVGEEFER
jgi:integrase